jgi:SWI/SNF-related matrix-associated actin-dependent regulator 1 of chromatin subfamily A
VEYTLFPYQQQGVEWLLDQDRQRWAYLADEPGLGKSAQCLEALNRLKPREALVLCPAIARLNWFGEAEKFLRVPCSLTAYSFNTTFVERENPKQRKVTPRKELLRPWPVIIIDEAHYLANLSAQRTKAVYLHIAQYGAKVWCLSGTPAKKDAGDMYTWLRASGLITLGPTSNLCAILCGERDQVRATDCRIEKHSRASRPVVGVDAETQKGGRAS